MHIRGEMMKESNFVGLSVFKNIGNKFYGQYRKITGQTKSHFRQHGMDIGMPENEPAAQGLTDINGKDQQCRTIADETDDDGKIDDVFQFIPLKIYFNRPVYRRPLTARSAQIRANRYRSIIHKAFPDEPAYQRHGTHNGNSCKFWKSTGLHLLMQNPYLFTKGLDI
jgi:hypothetical protein